MDAAALWEHLRRSHGIISRAEAVALGVSRGQIDRFVARGEWVRIAPGVFAHRAHPLTWAGRARAHALSAGGLVSHRAAAAAWGIDGFKPGRLELVVPRGRRVQRAGVVVHESTQFDLADARLLDAVPVTGPARTVLDVAAVVPAHADLVQTIDAVRRTRLVSDADLVEVVVRHARRGRDGSGRLRAALADAFGGSGIAGSRFNRMVGQLLVDAGLPEPIFEHPVHPGGRSFRIDLAYPEQRLGIECDSVQHHLNRISFVADPRRRNLLLIDGWRILNFTWADYCERPSTICDVVAAALEVGPNEPRAAAS